MAKNSFILDATRGSVGNIVVRRSGGRTILSAKPTEVSNPKTWAQAEVRMRMAAVSTFYSPLADYLAKGVQGKTRVESQSQLTRDNLRLMQENMWGVFKGYGWAPLPLWLTKGSKPEIPTAPVWDSAGRFIAAGFELGPRVTSDINTIGQMAEYLRSAVGITADEMQLTIVIALDGYHPVAERFQLSVNDTAAVASLSTSRFTFSLSEEGEESMFVTLNDNYAVGVGVILTAWDGRRWLRTNSRLHVSPYVLDKFSGDGPYVHAVESFMNSQDTSTPDGDVWLDGYTRRSGSGGGGGGGSLYPWADIPVFINDARVQGVTITGPAIVSQGGNQLVGVTLSDGRTLAVTGDERSTNYGKGITQAGAAVSVEGLGTAGVQFGTASSLELAANLSVYYNIPLSVFFG